LKALPQGQYIKHYRYGFGVITASDDEGTSIEFEQHGSKKFVTSLMVVELSDLTPPKGFRAKWVKTAPAPRPVRKVSRKKTAASSAASAPASVAEPAGRVSAR
jgi:hypothetical protein